MIRKSSESVEPRTNRNEVIDGANNAVSGTGDVLRGGAKIASGIVHVTTGLVGGVVKKGFDFIRDKRA